YAERSAATVVNRSVILHRSHLLERPLRRRVVERVKHGDAAQELHLHRRVARVGEIDLAELVARLGEGGTRRGERKSDQRRCEVDTRFHLYTLLFKIIYGGHSCRPTKRSAARIPRRSEAIVRH